MRGSLTNHATSHPTSSSRSLGYIKTRNSDWHSGRDIKTEFRVVSLDDRSPHRGVEISGGLAERFEAPRPAARCGIFWCDGIVKLDDAWRSVTPSTSGEMSLSLRYREAQIIRSVNYFCNNNTWNDIRVSGAESKLTAITFLIRAG